MAEKDQNKGASSADKGDKRNKTEGTSKKDRAYIAVIVLLLITTGILTWQLSELSDQVDRTTAEKKEVKEKKARIKKDLEGMLAKYDSLETNNKKLNEEMKQQKDSIKKLLEKVDRYQYSVSKLKKEKKELRNIMQGYVREIDSLNRANKKLKAENRTIRTELDTVQSEKEKLESKADSIQENLEKAKVLNTSNLEAKAIKFNLLGNAKVTTKARKTEKIKTCFTINENEFAPTGKRTIYIRVITPEGQVLARGDDGATKKFEFEGVRGQYTLKKRIEYGGREKDMCLYWDLKDQEAPEGKYGVKVYEGKKNIGSTTMKLE